MPGFLADALTRDENYVYALAIETAINFKLQPTVMLLKDKQPEDGWTDYDKKLAVAWTILNKETCKQCGQPMWICRSSEKNLMFSVRVDTCYASAEFEKWGEGKRAKSLKKGEKPYLIAKMRDDQPKPSRLDYLREQTDE